MQRQLSDEVTDALREDIRSFLKSRPDVSYNDLIHHTALSESTGRLFRNGHCPGGREVASQLRKALNHARAGDILTPGGMESVVVAEDQSKPTGRIAKRHRFYETQTAKRIAEVLDYCQQNAAIGVVTADFGVGKTEAVAAWRRKRGRKCDSSLMEMDEFSSSNKVHFVARLAKLFGLPVSRGSGYAPENFEAAIEYLNENPCLLIFDQCEVVRAKIFQIIRQLHDRTQDQGVGVVILAAPVLLTRLARSGMQDLGALTSRVGIWAPLSGVSRAEMAAIVKQEGFRDVDEAAFDLWWRSTGGSMRRLMRSLDLIRSKHSGRAVTEKTVAGVAGHLWGMTWSTNARTTSNT